MKQKPQNYEPQMIEQEYDIYKRLRVNKENTLENFKVVPGSEVCVQAIKGVIDGKRPIAMIMGGVGNGKTHLLHAAAIELYKKGKFVRVLLYADILNFLKKSMNSKELNYNDILDNYCYAERLIIDDVGAGGTDTEYSDNILEHIIVSRYEASLLTVMSTNRQLKDLPERVVSRLKDKTRCYLVVNKANDYRPEKK